MNVYKEGARERERERGKEAKGGKGGEVEGEGKGEEGWGRSWVCTSHGLGAISHILCVGPSHLEWHVFYPRHLFAKRYEITVSYKVIIVSDVCAFKWGVCLYSVTFFLLRFFSRLRRLLRLLLPRLRLFYSAEKEEGRAGGKKTSLFSRYS